MPRAAATSSAPLVTLRSAEGFAQVSVRDWGVGLSAQEAAQVFTRFWRADPSRVRRIGGSGLGLSIALGDARAHGGTLTASGQSGDGANFTLRLPLAPTGVVIA